MIDYRELDALAKDPKRANATAAMLLELEDTDWNVWETDFLEHMSAWRSTSEHPAGRGADRVTRRQRAARQDARLFA